MKKGLIIIVVLLLLCGCNNIKIRKNLFFEINSNLHYSDLVQESDKSLLIEPDGVIDTSVLGNKEVTINYKKNNGKIYNKTIIINIIDTIAPEIDCKDTIKATKGKSINIYDHITVKDNSNEEIKYEVSGTYNINKLGDYPLKIMAVDSTGNISTKNITLTVKEITVKTKGYYIYKPKSFWEALSFRKNNKVEEDLILCPASSCGLYSEYGTYTINSKKISVNLTSYKDESGSGKTSSKYECDIISEKKIVCDGKTYKWYNKLK